MTDSPRDRARALLDAATPEPWRVQREDRAAGDITYAIIPPNEGATVAWVPEDCNDNARRDAALIAAAPELLAALCDELDRAEAEVARMRTALRKTSDLIAANRLVLGEYTGPRYVSAIEDAARDALAETEETER